MRIFALFAALEASCPANWSPSGASCVPGSDWSLTCGSDGTMTISAHINYFYENAPENIKAKLISALKSKDGWGDVDGSADMLQRQVPASYDMRQVDGVDTLVGAYNFGPSDEAASEATAQIGEISLELATPLNFQVECLWPAELDVRLDNVDVAESGATFDGSSSEAALSVSLALSGADPTSNKWALGDTVTINVQNNLAEQVNVVIGIEKCTAYSDAGYAENAVTISYGQCGAAAINAKALNIDNEYFASTIEFDAFKYNAVANAALDANAYVSCNVRVCLKNNDDVNEDCKNAASLNQDAATKDTSVDCSTTTTTSTTSSTTTTPFFLVITSRIGESFLQSGDGTSQVAATINAPVDYAEDVGYALVKGELHIFGGKSDGYKVLYCLTNRNYEIIKNSIIKFKNNSLGCETGRLLFERASGATQRKSRIWSSGGYHRKWPKR
jgi:hypothetical protein